MGKIRVKTLGNEDEQKEKEEARRRAEQKKIEEAKAAGGASDSSNVIASETKQSPDTEKKKQKNKYADKKATKSKRGKKYLSIAEKVNKTKNYSLKEALELLPTLTVSKFDETVELHINTIEKGISGSLTLPHGTGKTTKVKIADDAVIAEIEKGIIDFDVLVAEPSFMPKLAKVAKVLGPRGLMPNPKNGTVSPKPEEIAKKFEGGQLNYKTEAKAPIIHVVVGKVSFGPDKLTDNIKAFITSIQKKNIKNITLKSTMSPGIRVTI
jgi:large subunit ribosomal protein L1